MIDVVIVAAGKGTRLQPFTFEKPKCLVPVKGIPLIHHQLKFISDRYCDVDVDNLIIVNGYKGDKIKKCVKKHFKAKYVTNKSYEDTSCGYSMIKGLEKTKNDTLVFNGDLYFDKFIIEKLFKNKHDNCIGIKSIHTKFKLGERGFIDEDNNIKYIGKGNIEPYNTQIVGPTLLSKKGVENLIFLYNNLSTKIQKSIHCLPLFGLFAEKYELYGCDVNDLNVLEINSNRDWEEINKWS